MNRIPVLPWLDPVEQEEVVLWLIEYSLIRFSNTRDFTLRSGETTDIYINLRDARNNPDALELIAGLFAHPLRRLDVSRFVEVPDSVSCFAPLISRETRLPYITVRESPKEGLVAKASMIGSARLGERVALVDDVIADGASKIVPYRECVRAGLYVRALLVLVDRAQGWQKKFADENVHLPVWPGMTLHDVRRLLIQTFGVMERCVLAVEEKNPIIVALDGKSWEEILPVVDRLRPTGCILKVTDLLLAKDAEWLIPNLSVYGRVMADFKGHDIPNTLENYAKVFREYPPWAVTVHGSGGREMVQKTVKMLEGTRTKVLVVTVLTSLSADKCEEIYMRRPLDQVRVLARIAKEAGAHGLVCSFEEVSMVRSEFPSLEPVVTGVRSPGKDPYDQKRVGTPARTMEAGAKHVVIGRPITEAPDPVAEVYRVLSEELKIIL